jgi:hypothetical protein
MTSFSLLLMGIFCIMNEFREGCSKIVYCLREMIQRLSKIITMELKVIMILLYRSLLVIHNILIDNFNNRNSKKETKLADTGCVFDSPSFPVPQHDSAFQAYRTSSSIISIGSFHITTKKDCLVKLAASITTCRNCMLVRDKCTHSMR